MIKTDQHASYPLSASLTRRIVSYLNVYRLIVAMLLAGANFGGLVNTTSFKGSELIAGAGVIAYLLFAASHLFSVQRKNVDFFYFRKRPE